MTRWLRNEEEEDGGSEAEVEEMVGDQEDGGNDGGRGETAMDRFLAWFGMQNWRREDARRDPT